jgi:hypothetical protein
MESLLNSENLTVGVKLAVLSSISASSDAQSISVTTTIRTLMAPETKLPQLERQEKCPSSPDDPWLTGSSDPAAPS